MARIWTVLILGAALSAGLPAARAYESGAAAARELRARMNDWDDDRFEARELLRRQCGRGWRPGPESAEGVDASLPLRLPLSKLEGRVPLAAEEVREIARLRALPLPEARGERARVFADSARLAMSIALRLYGEQLSGLERRGERCAAYSLRIERASRLLDAAAQALKLYGIVEQDLPV